MSNYNVLKNAIQNAVDWDNNDNQISGNDMLAILLSIINNTVVAGYQYIGVATPSTNPGTPDQNVFYITTTPGTYQNFGGLSIDKNEVAILKYNGEWIKEVTGCVSTSIVNELGAAAAVTGLSIDKKFNLEWTDRECVTTNGKILGMPSGVYASRRYIPVKQGQRLYLNVHAPGVTDVCAWYDTDYNFLSSFTASQTYVTAPQNGFLRVSNESAVVASPYVQLVTSDFLSSEELRELNVDAPVYDQQIAETYDFDLDLDWETGATLGATGEATISGASYRHTPDYHFTFPGQTFKIDLTGTGTARSVCFYDEDKTFLSGTYGGVDVEVVAPANARFVRFGSENGTHVSVSNVHTQEPFAAKDVVEGINERVEQIEQYIGASFDALSPVEEGLLFATTGEVYPHVSGNNYRYCPTYFRVYPGQAVHTTGRSTGSCAGICFYDENKNFVSSEDGSLTLSDTFTVPEGAAYARFCTEYYTTYGLAVTIEPIKEIPGISNAEKPFFVSDEENYDVLVGTEGQGSFVPSTPAVEHKYVGQLNPEKRYLCIGFDDFRDSDFEVVMPLFEKYGFKTNFNRIARSVTLSESDKVKLNNLIMGRHELGDHSWLHEQFPFTEPMFNGQDPSSPEGSQTPFPTNSQMRDDRGDGKNVFGILLTTPVSTTNAYNGPAINTAWGSLSDAECQTIREWYSVMKDTNTNLIEILDTLSNMFLGTSGSSRGSWNPTSQQYTGGIFTGCKTSANHEIWERYLIVTQMFYLVVAKVNYRVKTWSLPGSKDSNCWFENDGKKYYDSTFTKYANYLAKFPSSRLTNPDGTAKNRSWTDCLREFGFTATHDFIWPGRIDGSNGEADFMADQFILGAKGRRNDAIPYPSNCTRTFNYDTVATAYPASSMTGTKSLAAQMYDSTRSTAFKDFIEAARRKMSNGIIDVEIADSVVSYSFRLFIEGLLKYCKATGVEIVTKQEAYDICFNHIICGNNLIYNPRLRNTAKEFMQDATTVPTNPDGYDGDCSVNRDSENVPILVTTGLVRYLHMGIPDGKMTYSALVKGTGTITVYAVRNNTSRYYTNLVAITASNVANTGFGEVEMTFTINEPAEGEYEQIYEGLGEKIIGILIEYSSGLQVKQIGLYNR